MENPATWGEAEKIVHAALRKADSQPLGFAGLSHARQVTDALRKARLLGRDIYIALQENYPGDNCFSFVQGAFSTEEKARKACQDDADGEADVTGRPARQLEWKDAGANGPAGRYTVILADLDTPI